MILYSIPDIRLFWSQDERFLSQFEAGKITTFRPYSKYPPCHKDVSFWLPPQGLHENDFCDMVRDAAGDLVEDVKLVRALFSLLLSRFWDRVSCLHEPQIDDFTHPKTGRRSQCYRINYRSMDRSLSNEEANEVHASVISRLKDNFGVEIR